MNSLPPENEFDLEHCLRDIAVPTDLVARLKTIPTSDEALDETLRRVQVPPTLLGQLHEIAEEPLPSVTPRSRPSQKPSRRWVAALAWATAASLLLAVGLTRTWQGVRPGDASIDVATHIPDQANLHSADSPDLSEVSWLGPTPAEVAQYSPLATTASAPLTSRPPADWTAEASLFPVAPGARDLLPKSMAEELPTDLMANTFLMRWQPLGANPVVRSPSRRPLMLVPPHSVVSYFPEAKAYDRDFLLRESTHPFTPPKDGALREVRLPVSATTDTYEELVFGGTDGLTVPLTDARVEDFLAATGKFFVPAPPRKVEIRTAAGPAVFAPNGTYVLQIGVVAGAADPEDRPPAHMTVAVAPPDSTDHAQQTWQPVKIALRELIDHLGPHDTVSLVVMSEYPYVLLEDVTAEHRDAWFAALDRLQPGTPHLAEGIRFAAATAVSKPGFGDIRRPLIVFSDRFPGIDATTGEQLRPLVQGAADEGIDLTWVQLEDAHYASITAVPPALEGVGQWLVTDSLRTIGHLLDHKLHGAETLIGTNATIRVRWNDQSVEEYRLVGYQPHGGGLEQSSSTLELHAHDSGSVLFELRLPEEGPNEIAQIQLRWQNTQGEVKTATQMVSRLQFAPSWQSSALSLQAAQLAQQCLQLKQNAYFPRRRGNTADEWDQWYSSASPALRNHVSFPRLSQLLPIVRD